MRKAILSLSLFSLLYTTAFSQTPDSLYAKLLLSPEIKRRPDSLYVKWLFTPEIKRGFDFSLDATKLTYKDFTFRTDYWEIDSARLTGVNQLMSNPLNFPYKVFETAEMPRDGNFNLIVLRSLSLNGLHISGFIDTIAVIERLMQLKKQLKNFASKKANYPETFKENLFLLLALLPNEGAIRKYDNKQMGFIQNELPKLILEDTSEEKLSVDELDSIQKAKETLTREFAPLATASRYTAFNRYIGAHFFQSLWRASNLAHPYSVHFTKRAKEILWENKKERIVIGGPGPNHYKGDYALIIDFGGDDTYELTRRPNFTGQVIIDLGGNDKYFALEDYALACGYFGYSVLIDVVGDDLYQGKNFSVGCGFFGCGLLWDQAGNDTYIGDQFTQGAGGFGIGILKDDGGNDRYQAARAGQGFGFVRGVGALLDANGSDNYFAGGKYKELLGLSGEIRYMSESQGYATGLRPDLSGGMGFLFDYDGDDSYNIDMNGQGASYWWGLGALVDFKGNDRYLAQQYAQGAGVHMSLGCLVDSSGNDFYFSKGVSQGCGHDLGVGMLFDLSGNDNYVAADGSQAYGSANGFGTLVDGQGNDGYYVKDKKTTQGVGNPRREYGSIAVFLDCGGNDRYDGNGGENRFWKPTGTMWGVGVDGEFGALDTAQVKK